MRLTNFTDYSLRVLIYLALRPEERVTISEIARAFEVSENHLMKVVHFLGKAQVLANVRGKGGGLMLARPPDKINIGDVVRITEADVSPAECFGDRDNHCVLNPVCELRPVFAEAVASFYATLDRYTLADVTKSRAPLAKILLMPRNAKTKADVA